MVIGTDQFFCRDTAFINIELYPTHQVYAGGDVVTAIGIPVQLSATSGSVGSYTWLPNSFLTCSICQDPIANPNYNFSYQVVFTDTNGCKTIDFLDINYKGILYIPNTFTPDGSRFNEVFKAYGEGIITFEMLIFDRWGELIYSMDSMDDYWDGTYKGKICQDGTYTWKLKYTDITEEVKHVAGHVNLLK
jgi:gliding motility-associated-like protein